MRNDSNTTESTDTEDSGVRFLCSSCKTHVIPDDGETTLRCDMCEEECVLCDDCHPGELPRGAVWLCCECR